MKGSHMTKLLLGTTNISKFHRYKTILGQCNNVEVTSLRDLDLDTTKQAVEDGSTPEENARKKAEHYTAITGLPTLSVDEALFIDGLSPEDQPGVQVRRYRGESVADETLLDIYLQKIRSFSLQKRYALWIFAICLAFPSGHVYTRRVEITAILTDQPSLPLLPGYPLSSLMIDPVHRKHVKDLSQQEQERRLKPVYEAVTTLVQKTLLEQKYPETAMINN
jgi:inosine/xanthosine triphosphate pyrophosphatase family protein